MVVHPEIELNGFILLSFSSKIVKSGLGDNIPLNHFFLIAIAQAETRDYGLFGAWMIDIA